MGLVRGAPEPARPGSRRARASTVSMRRRSRLPHLQSQMFVLAASAHSPAMRPKPSPQSRPHIPRAAQVTRSSCASGEVNRASESPCVNTTSPEANCFPPHRARLRRDRSDKTPLPTRPHKPGTFPASILTQRKSGFKQNAPIRQHIRGKRTCTAYTSAEEQPRPAPAQSRQRPSSSVFRADSNWNPCGVRCAQTIRPPGK